MNTERVEQLREQMASASIDCAVLVPGPNLYYLTGLSMHLSERVTAAFIMAEGQVALVLPMLEKPQVESHIQIEAELFAYRDEEGPDFAMKNAIRALSLDGKKLGVEYQTMRMLEHQQLVTHAPNAQYAKIETQMAELRMIKDEDEISKLRQAIKLTEEVLQRTLSQLQRGVTEHEAALVFQQEALKVGGTMSFTPIVASGPNGGSPHVIPGSRELRDGDLVTIDAGVFYEHYPGDITRNVAVGKLDPKLEEIHEVVAQANTAGREAAGPGVACQDVDRAARKVVVDAGYGDYFIHRTGHGLGLEVHEPPYIMEGNEQVLRLGMTFTIEPGIYIPGLGGARVEDDMLITSDGAESLTTMSRDLTRI